MRRPSIAGIAIRSLALFLGLALILLPVCPARACAHSCCPGPSHNCTTVDSSVAMICGDRSGVLAPSNVPVQNPALSNSCEFAHSAAAAIPAPHFQVDERSGFRRFNTPTPPLRI